MGRCKAQAEELARHHELYLAAARGQASKRHGSGELVASAAVVFFQMLRVRKTYCLSVMVQIKYIMNFVLNDYMPRKSCRAAVDIYDQEKMTV